MDPHFLSQNKAKVVKLHFVNSNNLCENKWSIPYNKVMRQFKGKYYQFSTILHGTSMLDWLPIITNPTTLGWIFTKLHVTTWRSYIPFRPVGQLFHLQYGG
jgi:hypothetical protein